MADEECALYGASVGIRVLSAQKLDVVIVVVVIDGTVECQHNHLWNLQAWRDREIWWKMFKLPDDIHNDVDNNSHVMWEWRWFSDFQHVLMLNVERTEAKNGKY